MEISVFAHPLSEPVKSAAAHNIVKAFILTSILNVLSAVIKPLVLIGFGAKVYGLAIAFAPELL